MGAIETWCQGKPPFLAALAVQVATAAEACYEAGRISRTRDTLDDQVRMPPLTEWYRLYRQHRRVMKACQGNLLAGTTKGEVCEALGDSADAVRQWQHMDPAAQQDMFKGLTWDDLREAAKGAEAFFSDHLAAVLAVAKGTDGSQITSTEMLRIPEILFFLKVAFPCWLEYGKPVALLLRQARRGDSVDAVEDLLRLDKSAIEDRRVREYYHLALAENSTAILKRLHAAQAGGPLGRFSIQNVKVSLAALVFMIFKSMDDGVQSMWRRHGVLEVPSMKLTIPDVRALFDAVAKDIEGSLCDSDLPGEDHALYMAIKRELPFWSMLNTVKPTLTHLPPQV